uniref:Keratinocyte associated protein 3 n=1 Tax=Anas platyrhynchos platyrhynchos TaxID=8840 RepID=A0A493SWY5_ANAPP
MPLQGWAQRCPRISFLSFPIFNKLFCKYLSAASFRAGAGRGGAGPGGGPAWGRPLGAAAAMAGGRAGRRGLAALAEPRRLMRAGLGLIVLGHGSLVLGAIVHGSVLRHVARASRAVTPEYAVANVVSVVSGLLSITAGIVAILVSHNLSRAVLVSVGLLDRELSHPGKGQVGGLHAAWALPPATPLDLVPSSSFRFCCGCLDSLQSCRCCLLCCCLHLLGSTGRMGSSLGTRHHLGVEKFQLKHKSCSWSQASHCGLTQCGSAGGRAAADSLSCLWRWGKMGFGLQETVGAGVMDDEGCEQYKCFVRGLSHMRRSKGLYVFGTNFCRVSSAFITLHRGHTEVCAWPMQWQCLALVFPLALASTTLTCFPCCQQHWTLLSVSLLNCLLSTACSVGLALAIALTVHSRGMRLVTGCNSSALPADARVAIATNDCPFNTTRIYDTALALWFPSMVLVAAEAVLSGRCCLVALILQDIGPCGRTYGKDQLVKPGTLKEGQHLFGVAETCA